MSTVVVVVVGGAVGVGWGSQRTVGYKLSSLYHFGAFGRELVLGTCIFSSQTQTPKMNPFLLTE